MSAHPGNVTDDSFSDFLVNEISLSGEVLHLRDIGIPPEVEQPEESSEAAAVPSTEGNQNETSADSQGAADGSSAACDGSAATLPTELEFAEHADWPSATTVELRRHFSDDTIVALRRLFDEGRTPPPRQDSGWGSREKQRTEQVNEEEQAMNVGADPRPSQGRGRGSGRGGRGGSNSNPFSARDSREVVTQVSDHGACGD